MEPTTNEPPSGLPLASCSASSEPMHVYDWLELPPANDEEKDAREWLDKFLRPAWSKMTEGIEDWLARYRVTVEWNGRRYTCSGASRMGDVWLKTEGSANYYDHRVNVEELSNWKRLLLPNKNVRDRRPKAMKTTEGNNGGSLERMVRPLACPFCGATNITVEWEPCPKLDATDTTRRWFAECTQCSCQGPFCQKEPQVIPAWNKRSNVKDVQPKERQ